MKKKPKRKQWMVLGFVALFILGIVSALIMLATLTLQ